MSYKFEKFSKKNLIRISISNVPIVCIYLMLVSDINEMRNNYAVVKLDLHSYLFNIYSNIVLIEDPILIRLISLLG